MKGIRIERPGMLAIVDMEAPQMNERDNVLVKMRASGICRSDVGIYHGTNAAATYPRVMGHEIVGVVEAIKPGVTRVKPGDRVIIDQVISCGECWPCRHGRGNVCDHLQVRGVHIDGGYREYIAVPEMDCYRIPDQLSDADAVMIEPTTIAIQCCARAELTDDDTLLILGCGALGSTILKVARLTGARIIVADVVQGKLDEAMSNGADYSVNLLEESLAEKANAYSKENHGPTVSVDAACVRDSLLQLVSVTGNAGRVITMGFDDALADVTQFRITAKELDVRGSRLQNKRFQQAINLVQCGKLNLTGSVSHTFPYLEAQKAFDFVDSHDPAIRKVVLTF